MPIEKLIMNGNFKGTYNFLLILIYGHINLETIVIACIMYYSANFRMLTHLRSSVDHLSADNADVHDELKKMQATCSQVDHL